MSLYRDTCLSLLNDKDISTTTFYRFTDARTSKFEIGEPNPSNYSYISGTMNHHMYFTMKKLRYALCSAYYEITGESLTNTQIRSDSTFSTIKDLVLNSSVFKSMHSYRLVCLGVTEQMLKENSVSNSMKKNGVRFLERADCKTHGGGYGLADEWKELFGLLTFFIGMTEINGSDIWNIIIEMRSSGKRISKKSLKSLIENINRYDFKVNPSLLGCFTKYDIANKLETIVEKGLVLPRSELSQRPKQYIKKVVDDYCAGRERVLELLSKDY